MSLEAAILDHASAIRALADAINSLSPRTLAGLSYAPPPVPVKAEPVKAEPVKAEPVPVKAEPVKAEPVPVKAEPVKAVDYAEVQKAVLSAVVKNRSAVVETLAAYGATSAKSLPQAQYAPFIAALAAAVAASGTLA